jgi:microcystin-dependent protein
MTSRARNLARLVVDNSGALDAANLGNAPNPILAGTIAYLAMNTAPTGWLKANGANVSRTTYAALFAAIGTTYGAGDGSTTFALPDLRGEFPRGWDDGRGVDSGRAFGSAQAQQMEQHKHEMPARYALTGGSQGFSAPYHGAGDQYFIDTTNKGGTSNSSETRPRNIALLACIKF